MADNHVLAEQDYLDGMKYKDIADKYGVSLNTVKSWKKRHGWFREKGAPSDKSVHTKRVGAPAGNQNAKGNRGGAAPKGNQNAKTHGFFSKHLPADALEIMQQIQERSPIDMLWDNITIQYTAIIRAQHIMYVKDKEDVTEVLKREKPGEYGDEHEWEFQFAWDKQANFLQAQSRAMTTLQNMIKQYEEMCRQPYVDEEHKLRLEILKGKVAEMDTENKFEPVIIKDDLHE
ncbi:phage terminase small subunit [Paenibacillus shunpengii]|uniref:Phage terminase small subunit n=1 Tax=Paenibacillus shunpengii TaxID=2054424 RepID=A0ABW5SVH2_9BACL